MYYTYVLQCFDKKHYVGCSKDLRNRIAEHINGKISATRNRRPVKLVYYEACLSKVKAFKREKYFKSGFGRRFLKERV